MALESHTLMDGKVHVYRRENSRFWQCSVFLGGYNHRASTKQDNLVLAIEYARDWYMDRYADDRLRRRGIALPGLGQEPIAGLIEDRRRRKPTGPTFSQAADAFVAEYEIIAGGERNKSYVASKSRHIRLYLKPFFGDTPLSEINAGRIQDYRAHRLTPRTPPTKKGAEADSSPKDAVPEQLVPSKKGKKAKKKPETPARNTLHQELVTLRQVLKTANRKGWLAALPDMSAPYRASSKISHRAWFSPEEYQRFYEATRERSDNPKNERWRYQCKQFHDYVLFMGNTGLRPDEASRLQYRDIKVVWDEDTRQRILEIEVRGKRGVGYCKSMPGAVEPFQRLCKRNTRSADDNGPPPTKLVFGPVQRELLNSVLDELELKYDRDDNPRTAYSLRHTYISMRLMEGADIYQIAKNCRTSVEMIQKFYASHIVNTLDAAAINVRKKRRNDKSADEGNEGSTKKPRPRSGAGAKETRPRNGGSAKTPAKAKASNRAKARTPTWVARTR